MQKGPVVLLILDGWGLASANKGNAIELAKKPHFDYYWKNFPHTKLKAHGKYVGVPAGQVGNSEAGHVNIGAGRVIMDDAVQISDDIKLDKLKKNLAINQTIDHVKENKSSLHLMGLAPDGYSPHGDVNHLCALVDIAYNKGVRKIYMHLFTDGRDSPQFAAIRIMENIENCVKGHAKIASLIGRFYAMDRGKNWQRIEKAYDCLTGSSCKKYKTYSEALLHSYNQGVTDEYIEPVVVCERTQRDGHCRIKDNDGIIFFNLRSDRARQLSKCFVQEKFNQLNPGAFKRKKFAKNLVFCALTDFGPDLDSILTAYPSADLKFTIPHILNDKKQIYIAETEKYAHVTYFMNGGYADPQFGEDRLRIPSPRIKSYAQKPEMSVYKITKKVKQLVNQDKYDFYAINFANPDMVGHTGDLKKTIEAIEHVDNCLHELTSLILKKKGAIMITADHGNAEKMIDLQTNEIWAEHTTNPVPFILVDNERKGVKLRKNSIKLANILATICDIFEVKDVPKIIEKSIII